jgi:hypothetical protein
MSNPLDLKSLKSGFLNIKVGRLSKKIIDILNLNREECDIILWEDRFKYIEKHKVHFDDEADYMKHIACIPEVIESPDYVGKHPADNSIEYIKRIDKLMIVAIRIKDKGNLAFRTAFPLSENQLQDYIRSGTVWKVY